MFVELDSESPQGRLSPVLIPVFLHRLLSLTNRTSEMCLLIWLTSFRANKFTRGVRPLHITKCMLFSCYFFNTGGSVSSGEEGAQMNNKINQVLKRLRYFP